MSSFRPQLTLKTNYPLDKDLMSNIGSEHVVSGEVNLRKGIASNQGIFVGSFVGLKSNGSLTPKKGEMGKFNPLDE